MLLQKARTTWNERARWIWALAWSLFLDLLWLAAIVVAVGAAIWTTAHWVEATGRAIPILSKAAGHINTILVRLDGGR